MNLECRHLTRAFATSRGPVHALEDVSFRAGHEEFVCIVGPSGCGKTTILRIIAGLIRPTSGEVVFDGAPSDGRLHCALVFQEHGLFPWRSLQGNVEFGLECLNVPRAERRRRAETFIAKVGLAAFARNYPHELSVGMRQRASIARAFASDPELLLMDEPFGALDAQTKFVLQEELLRIWKEHRKGVVYVTHDIREAIRLSDRILVMSGHPGRIREEIPVPLERPRDLASLEREEAVRIEQRIWSILEEEVRRLMV